MVTKMPKYEYKIEHLPKFANEAESKLNTLAKDMWELVTIFNHPNPNSFAYNPQQESQSVKDSILFAIFKRQTR